MWRKKKEKSKKLKRGAIPHIFLILGILGAGLTNELLNMAHYYAEKVGETALVYYSLGVLAIWIFTFISISKLIDKLYEK